MYQPKIRKSGLRIMVLALVLLFAASFTVGCGGGATAESKPAQTEAPKATQAAAATEAPAATQAAASGGLHKLTQQDVKDIFTPGTDMKFLDSSMKEAVNPPKLSDLDLTDEEKAKIRPMNLKVGLEDFNLDDPTKQMWDGFEEVAKDLNITVKDKWLTQEQNSPSQMDDFQRIEAVAQNYNAIFCLPNDVTTSSEILKKIMKKTKVGFWGTPPLGVDWKDPNYIGVVDCDGYQAGIYSAKAAIKILNGQGTIGTIGYVNGKTGANHITLMRYQGWEKVFKENPDVKVVQKWFDDPSQVKPIVNSMLAANPDIKVMLIDWANPPADQAQAAFKERGLKPWKDIGMVTIDLDNTIAVPMAKSGPDNNYTSAYITQTWYNVGKLMAKMYAKNVLYGEKAPRFIASPPLPVTTYETILTHFKKAVPEGFQIPPEITGLQNQWPLGVEDQWK